MRNNDSQPDLTGYWGHLTTTDFSTLNPEETIALLPVAAIEQHGPHLPLETDACISEGLVKGLLGRSHDRLTLVSLPPMVIGDSTEHIDYSGTLSANTETLVSLWSGIGKQVAKSGIQKLLILNTHGGQPQIVDIVAQRLRAQDKMLVVGVSTFKLGIPEGLFNTKELQHGLHGGEIETSLMLFLKPELVRPNRANNFISSSWKMEETYSRLSTNGPAAFAWQAQDLHELGVVGDAAKADAKRGSKLFEFLLDEISLILRDMRQFPISDLKNV